MIITTTMSKSFAITVYICVISLLTAIPAIAQVFVETDDAGSTFETAIYIGPDINAIEGSLGLVAGEDTTDIFKLVFEDNVMFSAFNLTWTAPNTSNSSVIIYDELGQVMDACDQSVNGAGCFVPFGNQNNEILNATLSAGIYYLEFQDDTPSSSPIGAYGLEFTPLSSGPIFKDGFESEL